MRYVEARIDETKREEAYRILVTKGLTLIPQNRYMTLDYMDLINPVIKDTGTGDEIALNVIKNAGLSFGETL